MTVKTKEQLGKEAEEEFMIMVTSWIDKWEESDLAISLVLSFIALDAERWKTVANRTLFYPEDTWSIDRHLINLRNRYKELKKEMEKEKKE